MLIVQLVAFFAAFVTGAFGYGFSTVLVPVSLLYYASRLLNPALVVLEVGMNFSSLYFYRKNIFQVLQNRLTLILGLVPALILGGFLVQHLKTDLSKPFIYLILLLIIGFRNFGFKIREFSNRIRKFGLGATLGFIYSLTTISGPPLAIALKMEKKSPAEFLAHMSVLRTVESLLAAVIYLSLGLIDQQSLFLSASLLPAVVMGVTVGWALSKKIRGSRLQDLGLTLDFILITLALHRCLLTLQVGPAWMIHLGAFVILTTELIRIKRQKRLQKSHDQELANFEVERKSA